MSESDREPEAKPEELSPPDSGPESTREGESVDPDLTQVWEARGGNERAFELLLRRHQDRVYTRIYFMVRDRGVAEDLTQETFLRAYSGLAGFREESRFSTWLHRIAVNVTLHHIEKTKTQKRAGKVISIHAAQRQQDDAGEIEIPDSRQLPDEWAVRQEQEAAILRAVGELPEEFRVALALRDVEGLRYQEISELLELPIGTVKSKIFRARQILQEKLEGIL